MLGYLGAVEPSIDMPYVLLGFFVILYLLIASCTYIVTAKVRTKSLRYAVCAATPAALVIIAARSSLGSLGWGTVGLVTLIYAGLIWYITRALSR